MERPWKDSDHGFVWGSTLVSLAVEVDAIMLELDGRRYLEVRDGPVLHWRDDGVMHPT